MARDVFSVIVVLHGEGRVSVFVSDEITIPTAVRIIDGVRGNNAVSRGIEGCGVAGTFAVDLLVDICEERPDTEHELLGGLVFSIDATTDAFQA